MRDYCRPQVFAIPVLLLGICACSSAPTEPDGEKNSQKAFVHFLVGTSWTYEWQDFRSGETDTVIVRVASDIDSTEVGFARVWEIEHDERCDTMLVAIVGDTVRFYPASTVRSWAAARIIFPLYVGAKWWGRGLDSSRVTDEAPISVPAGRFDSAFQIELSWHFLNEFGHVKTWIVPSVGIVFESQVVRGFTRVTSWERRLIEYEIIED